MKIGDLVRPIDKLRENWFNNFECECSACVGRRFELAKIVKVVNVVEDMVEIVTCLPYENINYHQAFLKKNLTKISND